MRRAFPSAAFMHAVQLGEAEAATALLRHDGAGALAALKPALRYDYGTPPDLATIYHRGMAYLELRDGPKAASEFNRLLEHRGIAPNGIYVALAPLRLGRALALAGDVGGARRAYEEFFAAWKSADADVPVLIDARAEYALLGKFAPVK
jgi:tetratricopeptide (TPR) repeat protein